MIDNGSQSPRHPIGVLIIEDSATIRRFLEDLMARDPRLRVLAAVESAEEGLEVLDRLRPDVISLDIRLPGMNGFEFTKRVMAKRPVPIVVCSASVESADLRITMNALRAGALSVVEKPVGTTHEDYGALAERLCTQLILMSQVRVVRQWNPRVEPRWEVRISEGNGKAPQSRATSSPALIGIVASTGGPNALAVVLGSLPSTYSIPILVVQHITASFSDGFIEWLGSVCPIPVLKAVTGQTPEPGRVYVAPAEKHLYVERSNLRVDTGPPVCMQCPSGSTLLHSMASSLGARAAGVVLTGMGEDGADGLLAVRLAGGPTIAEHRSTAVVYGMPGAAEKRGAASELLPLHAIGPRLREFTALPMEVNHERSSPDSPGRGLAHAGLAT